MAVSVPVPVSLSLSCPVLGFSGSRSVVPAVLGSVLRSLPVAAVVFVGDARGVDSAVRSAVPGCRVFRVSGSGRGAFAARSVRFVRDLAASGGVLFSFPGRACPVGLLPSADSWVCFRGLGSGFWATAALAVGLGVPVCLWLPAGVAVPASWGLLPVGGGWWLSLPF